MRNSFRKFPRINDNKPRIFCETTGQKSFNWTAGSLQAVSKNSLCHIKSSRCAAQSAIMVNFLKRMRKLKTVSHP